jgi:thiol reductant ABC exporter CydC subunit
MKKRSGFIVMARLIGLVRPLAGFMLLAVAMGLIGHLFAAFITIFGGYSVLNILGLDVGMPLAVLFVCMAVFAAARGILRYAEQACNHFIAFKLLALIRDKVFRALRRLCPAKLEGRDKGDLISVITSDIELLEVFYAHTISPVIIAAVFTVIMCLFIGSYHWLLGMTALAAYAAAGIAVPVAASRLSGDGGLVFRTKSGELSGFVLDSLRGMPEILQYGRGEARLSQMNERNDAVSDDEKKLKQNAGLNAAATNTVVMLSDTAMLLLAGWLYANGAVEFDGIVIPTLALFSSFGPVIALANLGSTLQNTFAAGNRVLDILDEDPVTADITDGLKTAFTGAEAEHVDFAYSSEKILSDVSVDVPENSIIGLIGRSGSGKSTLLKLFMRFWDAQKGSIKVSGIKIGQINTDNLRDMESFMTQTTELFHDSIKNNVRVAKLDATDEEIEAACKKASVHDFVTTLPNGYDTLVGELGDTLSGGERQRIGLARAFLHDAPFMLLDETTSNLDSLNEAVILKSLNEERNGKTVLLVSHRKSTMRIADKIYSVENGRIS